jgi:lysine 2,3-aminomutase
MPMGVTDEILSLISEASNRYTEGIPKHVYFMTHINHYHEITRACAMAVDRIHRYGFPVRNQTVFLNHVNDYYKTLAETFRRMLWIGVHPYYLLQCHKEKGLVHFIAPIQIGKVYMKHLQGWISGVAIPKYAANVEGGGGKILLMPTGHDTLNTDQINIEKKISESFATVYTWDSRELYRYEALGRATREEFEAAVEIMDRFIGRKGAFFPKVIIIDKNGNHVETTNRTRLPKMELSKKNRRLSYKVQKDGMPLTNPADLHGLLEEKFRESEYAGGSDSL